LDTTWGIDLRNKMKIGIGKRYLTRNGSIAKVESAKENGRIFYGTVNDEGNLAYQEWNIYGSTNDLMLCHRYELIEETCLAKIVLEHVSNISIALFALSLVLMAFLIILFATISLGIITFNLLFK